MKINNNSIKTMFKHYLLLLYFTIFQSFTPIPQSLPANNRFIAGLQRIQKIPLIQNITSLITHIDIKNFASLKPLLHHGYTAAKKQLTPKNSLLLLTGLCLHHAYSETAQKAIDKKELSFLLSPINHPVIFFKSFFSFYPKKIKQAFEAYKVNQEINDVLRLARTNKLDTHISEFTSSNKNLDELAKKKKLLEKAYKKAVGESDYITPSIDAIQTEEVNIIMKNITQFILLENSRAINECMKKYLLNNGADYALGKEILNKIITLAEKIYTNENEKTIPEGACRLLTLYSIQIENGSLRSCKSWSQYYSDKQNIQNTIKAYQNTPEQIRTLDFSTHNLAILSKIAMDDSHSKENIAADKAKEKLNAWANRAAMKPCMELNDDYQLYLKYTSLQQENRNKAYEIRCQEENEEAHKQTIKDGENKIRSLNKEVAISKQSCKKAENEKNNANLLWQKQVKKTMDENKNLQDKINHLYELDPSLKEKEEEVFRSTTKNNLEMLYEKALDQEAKDQEAKDQEAKDQEAKDQEAKEKEKQLQVAERKEQITGFFKQSPSFILAKIKTASSIFLTNVKKSEFKTKKVTPHIQKMMIEGDPDLKKNEINNAPMPEKQNESSDIYSKMFSNDFSDNESNKNESKEKFLNTKHDSFNEKLLLTKNLKLLEGKNPNLKDFVEKTKLLLIGNNETNFQFNAEYSRRLDQESTIKTPDGKEYESDKNIQAISKNIRQKMKQEMQAENIKNTKENTDQLSTPSLQTEIKQIQTAASKSDKKKKKPSIHDKKSKSKLFTEESSNINNLNIDNLSNKKIATLTVDSFTQDQIANLTKEQINKIVNANSNLAVALTQRLEKA